MSQKSQNQQWCNRYYHGYERHYSSTVTSNGVRVANANGRGPTVSSARPVMITPRYPHNQEPPMSQILRVTKPVMALETYSDFLDVCRDGCEDKLRHLMPLLDKLGPASVNKVDKSGKSGVSLVCACGNISMLQLISEISDVDINLADNEGNAPLHFAAQAGHAEVVQYLLDHCKDLDIDQRNLLGFTPLMKASLQGRNKCVKILLFAGASPLLRDHGRGLCALEWARYCSRPSCAEIIDKYMKSSNFTVTSPSRSAKDNGGSDRWTSEPNLQCPGILVGSPETKEGWLKQKIRKAFKQDSSKKTYSLVSELTSTALLASSPLVPTAAMGGPNNNARDTDSRNVIVVPKLQIMTADDITDTVPDVVASTVGVTTSKQKVYSRCARPPVVPRSKSNVSRR